MRQCRGGIVFVVQSTAFSLSHLSPAAWLVRRPVSGTCDYSRGCGFCWFAWYPRSPPETFRFPRSCHAQGLGNYPTVGIWLAQADGGLLHEGLISPCPIIVLTSTQVLPTDGANCRVLIWKVSFIVDVSESKPNRPNTMNLVEKRAQELGLCEDFVNGRAGSLGSRIVNGIFEGVKVRPRASFEDEFFFFSSSDTAPLELSGVFRIAAPLFVRSLWLYILLLPLS